MSFYQDPPRLSNGYHTDRVLKGYLQRVLGTDILSQVEPQIERVGQLSAGPLYELQQRDRLNEPRLTQWSPWGERIDRIEITDSWKAAQTVACEEGLIATAYERKHGALSRVHQFAMVHLFEGSSDVYTCPLAMTDGAATTLSTHDNTALKDRAVARLISRDPSSAWTSGQWMTERTGGSDVGASQTIAYPCDETVTAYGCDTVFRLHGTKWFTSASTSEMALTLARPAGQPTGGRGLTLFYVEMKTADGLPNGITVNRLKDKMGTRKLPTAELTLDGALAVPVAGIGHGIRHIAPMLNITRTWNAICSVGAMHRGLMLARDYASRRSQFGKALASHPLHVDTLAGLQAEYEAAFHLAFWTVELLGRHEAGEASEQDQSLLRLLTPLAKLTTAKQCVQVLSEVIECFGGAGYVEDTGIPRLLRDAQVLPIWEGTTNVLSLDVLRAIGKERKLPALVQAFSEMDKAVTDPQLRDVVTAAQHAFSHARLTLDANSPGSERDQRGGRRLALTLGRSIAAMLLARHAQWSLDTQNDPRPGWAAARFASHGIDQLFSSSKAADTFGLGMDVLA